MHSSISDDLNREHLALEAAKCLKNISQNNKNVSDLHKELLELNLSIKTYIEESKIRMKDIRLELASKAKSSTKVVDILSRNYTIECFPPRNERLSRKDDATQINPLNSPEICDIGPERRSRKRLLKSSCHSPQWAESCGPENEYKAFEEVAKEEELKKM
ncbi:unnamed protein product, partial [Iphiclides podalirius]